MSGAGFEGCGRAALVADLAARIQGNVDLWYADRLTWPVFVREASRLWDEARSHGPAVVDEVSALVAPKLFAGVEERRAAGEEERDTPPYGVTALVALSDAERADLVPASEREVVVHVSGRTPDGTPIAERAGRASRYEGMSREGLIGLLVASDPNGTWRDDDSRREGMEPITKAEAIAALRRQEEGDEDDEHVCDESRSTGRCNCAEVR